MIVCFFLSFSFLFPILLSTPQNKTTRREQRKEWTETNVAERTDWSENKQTHKRTNEKDESTQEESWIYKYFVWWMAGLNWTEAIKEENQKKIYENLKTYVTQPKLITNVMQPKWTTNGTQNGNGNNTPRNKTTKHRSIPSFFKI